MTGLGSDVSLFIRGDHALRKFDTMIQNGVHNALVHQGVNVVPKTNISAIEKQGNNKYTMVSREGPKYEDFDYVLYAIGRGPLQEELGLQHTDIEQDKRLFIKADEYEETTQKGVCIFAHILYFCFNVHRVLFPLNW